MILPWQVDVPQDKWPVMNWLIIAACVVVFVVQLSDVAQYSVGARAPTTDQGPPGITGAWLLRGWQLKGLLGYMWLHAGFLHLFGNMWFLWVFGNAVCSNIGNLRYLAAYVALGVVAGATHLLVSTDPVLGASGAINGIVGMYLVMFPRNEITCYFVFWFILPYVRQFAVSSFWMVLFWLFWNVVGALWSSAGVAYFAHLGGFTAGVGLGFLFCLKGWCFLDEYDRSLVQIWRDRRNPTEDRKVAPAFSALGLAAEDATPPSAVTTPKPVIPERLSIPMLDLNNGTPIPETAPGLLCTCGERIMVSKQYAGKVVRCPRCQAPVQIPSDLAPDLDGSPKVKAPHAKVASRSGMIRFACPCGQKIKVPARYGGRFGKCPRCNARLRIPSLRRRSH